MPKCKSCEDKPEKTRAFPSAVVEINNPEQLVLLRKVVMPASMGDDTTVPPAVGKYRNVILVYEANNHIYLYSSDGIPTKVDATVPQEVLDKITELGEDITVETKARQDGDADLSDRISGVAGDLADEALSRQGADANLQQEIDDLRNSPDVVDIVATYADLMSYGTQHLGDNDVIRVLRDETHDGQSAYYRWDAHNSNWVFIGTVGDYYTEREVDTLLDGKQDELTPGENISIVDESGELVISANDTTYVAGPGITITDESGALTISATGSAATIFTNNEWNALWA